MLISEKDIWRFICILSDVYFVKLPSHGLLLVTAEASFGRKKTLIFAAGKIILLIFVYCLIQACFFGLFVYSPLSLLKKTAS